MTKNKDFEDEKRIAVKTYLEQIHARLYMEQTLIAERIKSSLINNWKNSLLQW